MPIHVRDITIDDEGSRDHKKTYRLTEMPVLQSEKWAARAILALGQSGVDVPDEFRQRGMDAIVTVGLKALVGIEFAAAETLMDEMLECVTFVPDPRNPESRKLFPGDVEELATLAFLRGELMELHTGFTVRAGLWSLGTKLAQWITFHATQTSPPPLDLSGEAESAAGQNSGAQSG